MREQAAWRVLARGIVLVFALGLAVVVAAVVVLLPWLALAMAATVPLGIAARALGALVAAAPAHADGARAAVEALLAERPEVVGPLQEVLPSLETLLSAALGLVA